MTDNEIIQAFERIDYLEPESVKYSSPVPPTFVLACIKRLTAENENLRHIIRVSDEYQDELINTITQKDVEIKRLSQPILLIENSELSLEEIRENMRKASVGSIPVSKHSIRRLDENGIRSKAIKEFAEKLKEKFTEPYEYSLGYVIGSIEVLVKEMTEVIE